MRALNPALEKTTSRNKSNPSRRPTVSLRVRRRATATVVPVHKADDRRALALLLLPLFFVAFWLTGTPAMQTHPNVADLPARQASADMTASTGKRPALTLQERIASHPLTLLNESTDRKDLTTVAAVEAHWHRSDRSGQSEETHDVQSARERGTHSETLVQSQDPPQEVAALELKVPTIPQAPFSGNTIPAVPAGIEVCVADENTLMKRWANLGAPVSAADPDQFGRALAASAREQLGRFVIYTDKYHLISYPRGDVPALYGVCTDVIIRAYHGVGLDLQELVHEARVGIGDANIDHRRVKTLKRFFKKFGEQLPITEFSEDYKPGDIVTYYRPQNRGSNHHIAIVSDVYAPSGRPMIIHNRGWGPQQEDALFVDEMTGHYRFTGEKLPASLRQSREAILDDATTPKESARTEKETDVYQASYALSER